MRAVIQRVTQAHVDIDGKTVGRIEQGYLILLGVGANDTEAQAERLWQKILKLRIFPDGKHHTGASLSDVGGEVLIVSQFTLYADCRKGNRPSFTNAGQPEEASRLCAWFVERAKQDIAHVATGEFGADMQVSLVNDGPFTICLDTDDWETKRA